MAVHADLINNWAYFNFALINEDTGDAFDFGREVSYYPGSDSDGAWTEGSTTSTRIIPSRRRRAIIICASSRRWTLATGATYRQHGLDALQHSINYDIILRHDVPNYSWFWIAAAAAADSADFLSPSARDLSKPRWMQSDYPPVTSGGD